MDVPPGTARRRRRWLPWLALALALVGAVLAAAIASTLRSGISARDEPTGLEVAIARAARRLAMPSALRDARNPTPATDAVLAEARAHFADHCAACHGNDGAGRTEIGRNLYPRAPDLRRPPTQSLTDGELFGIVRNGIRLTGMPAWGDGSPESDRESWALVRFLRHLPALTDEEIEAMKALNPKTASDRREEQEEERFLEGEDDGGAPDAARGAHRAHHHGSE